MNNHPVRLQKEVKMTFQDRIENFILQHAPFFLGLAIALLLALMLTVCVAMCGICAVESGGMRNFLATGV